MKNKLNTKPILITVFFILCFTVNAFAQTTIKAEVDKTSITTHEVVTYKLIITSVEKDIPAPQLPNFKAFSILSQVQSSQISLVKREIKTTQVYNFILAPKGQGKFIIEPSKIKIKNKTYSTDAFEIEVTPSPEPPSPKELQPETEEPQITL